MRKIAVLLIVCCLLFHFSAIAEGNQPDAAIGTVAKVTTGKGPLHMRAKAGTKGAVIQEIPNGTCLLVKEENEDWCLCEWNGKSGYCDTSYLTFLREADLSLLDYRVLRKGDKGEDVVALKQRLQELGYIRNGSSLTSLFNDTLCERLILFERQVGMAEDGVASQELQAYLFSDKAPQCTLTLPKVRSQIKNDQNDQHKVICGCCFGEGCEYCGFVGWISY